MLTTVPIPDFNSTRYKLYDHRKYICPCLLGQMTCLLTLNVDMKWDGLLIATYMFLLNVTLLWNAGLLRFYCRKKLLDRELAFIQSELRAVGVRLDCLMQCVLQCWEVS